jgi:O-acetyl-ADP-ribose deacetylase (regulator of RNase III)
MIEKTGNLLNAEEVAIGHGVNTKGLMGAGVAKAIRAANPKNSGSSIQWCNNGAKGGDVQLYRVSPERIIVNIASQELPGADARYDWLTEGLMKAVVELVALDVHKLALPRIGAGIGGLDWEAVKIIVILVETIQRVSGVPFEFVIYTPPASTAPPTGNYFFIVGDTPVAYK